MHVTVSYANLHESTYLDMIDNHMNFCKVKSAISGNPFFKALYDTFHGSANFTFSCPIKKGETRIIKNLVIAETMLRISTVFIQNKNFIFYVRCQTKFPKSKKLTDLYSFKVLGHIKF